MDEIMNEMPTLIANGVLIVVLFLVIFMSMGLIVYLSEFIIAPPWYRGFKKGEYKVDAKKLRAIDGALGLKFIESGFIILGKGDASLSLPWKTRWNKKIILDALMIMAASSPEAYVLIRAATGVTICDPSTGKRVRPTAEVLQRRLEDRLAHLCLDQDVTTTITVSNTYTRNRKVGKRRQFKPLPVEKVYGPLAQVLALTQGTPYDAVLDTSIPELRLTLRAGTSMVKARQYMQIVDMSAELGLRINRTKQLRSLAYFTELLPTTNSIPKLPNRSAAITPLTEAIELGATITGADAAQMGLELPSPDPTTQAVTWFTPTLDVG